MPREPRSTTSYWLRLEGLAALALSIGTYASLGGSWIVFTLLLFVPDLSMLGYIKNPRVGATAYNLAHTYVSPALLAAAGWIGNSTALFLPALIGTAHIGLDRTLGYGLKLPTGFNDTHLGRIGRG